jgi:hypothetical protein
MKPKKSKCSGEFPKCYNTTSENAARNSKPAQEEVKKG